MGRTRILCVDGWGRWSLHRLSGAVTGEGGYCRGDCSTVPGKWGRVQVCQCMGTWTHWGEELGGWGDNAAMAAEGLGGVIFVRALQGTPDEVVRKAELASRVVALWGGDGAILGCAAGEV